MSRPGAAPVSLATLAELVRLPAALSVPGDAWCGLAQVPAERRPRRAWAMPVSSVLLYWSGMALNDWADRELDRAERPERPIPSGRIGADQALAVAAGLGAAGVAASTVVGGSRAARVSAPLLGLVAAYDVVAKDAAVGPVVMAGTRALDVVLGAYAAPAAAAAPATSLAAHTVGLTTLSRGEVHGARPGTARLALGLTALAAGTAAVSALRDRDLRGRDTVAALALAGAYATVVGRAQATAAADPSAAHARAATRTGIGAFPLLQAAWLARRGRLAPAAAVVAAGPAIRAASRRVSTT